MYFEDFEIGKVYKHQPCRTVTETDDLLLTCLTQNVQPLHLDEEFCKKTEFGTRVVDLMYTMGLLWGLATSELCSGTNWGPLGWDEVVPLSPVKHGDTICCETQVLSKVEHASEPKVGIVLLEHRGINQRGVTVMRLKGRLQVLKRAALAV